MLDGFDSVNQLRRQVKTAHLGHVAERVIALNGKNTGNDGTGDAGSATILLPIEIILGRKKELRDDEIRTCINLRLEMLNTFLIRGSIGVLVRVASHRDTKPISKLLADELDQVARIMELWLLFGLILGRITSKGKNVTNAGTLALIQNIDDLSPRASVADQVKVGIDTADVLGSSSDLERDVVSVRAVAAGSPSDVDEKLWAEVFFVFFPKRRWKESSMGESGRGCDSMVSADRVMAISYVDFVRQMRMARSTSCSCDETPRHSSHYSCGCRK